MLTVNGEALEFFEGMTVRKVLQAKNYTFPLLIVKINGRNVTRADYDSTLVSDDDEIKVIHLISGG